MYLQEFCCSQSLHCFYIQGIMTPLKIDKIHLDLFCFWLYILLNSTTFQSKMKLFPITKLKTSEETVYVPSDVTKFISSGSFSIFACENIPLMLAYVSAITAIMHICPTSQGQNWCIISFACLTALSEKNAPRSHYLSFQDSNLCCIQVIKRQDNLQIHLKIWFRNFLYYLNRK